MPLYEVDGYKVTTPGEGRYYVAPNAAVIGQVTLAEDTSVWFNAVIRGDNEPIHIGARTSIQDGAVLHVDPGFPMDIGEECTIGHMVMLHGCTIGNRTMIGMGSIILNGAKIGEGCLIGAGTLIPENKIIPPHSVVFGAPGKVIRETGEKERALLLEGRDMYVANGRRYMRSLKLQAT